MEQKHTINELKQWQSYPLSIKVLMTKERIRNWIREYGEDGVYVGFSGGKDSTVLLNLVRQDYPDVKGVFVDTGLEYPEVRDFVKSFENIDWLKPKINFRQVLEKYGYPFISKEVSECVDGARKYIKILTNKRTNEQTNEAYRTLNFTENCKELENTGKRKYQYEYNKLHGLGKYAPNPNSQEKQITSIENLGDWESIPVRVKILFGQMTKGNIPNGERSRFSCDRYKFLLDAPFDISSKCCNVMKKTPAYSYVKKQEGNLLLHKWPAKAG